MSTSLLSMNQSWCAQPTRMAPSQKIEFSRPTQNILIPTTMSMSLPSTFLDIPRQLSCSRSLPILCPLQNKITKSPMKEDQMVANNNDVQLASSLPNIKFLDQQIEKMPYSIDSFDFYKNKINKCQVEFNVTTSLRMEENSNGIINQSPVNKTERRRKNCSMSPIVPNFYLMAKLKQQQDSNKEEMSERDQLKVDQKLEEKTSFVPINVEANETFPLELDYRINNDNNATVMRETNDDDLNQDGYELNLATTNRNEKEHNKTPHLSQCGSFFKSGTKNETAAAWLAAATHQLSCFSNCHHHQTINNCQLLAFETNINSNIENVLKDNNNKQDKKCQQEKKIENETFKEKNARHQRVKRTSILRTHSPLEYEKKNVRFADTMGYELENVRYFVISPKITRRYSSYTSPTYLNTEWNTDSWNGLLKNHDNNANGNDNVPMNTKINHVNLSPNLVPRYELVMSNFISPSLNLDFSKKLWEKNVMLHSLTIAETTVYGNVSVMNIHFVKKVFVRYTFDDWANYIEREATYILGSHDGRTDKFSFVIYAHVQDFNLHSAYPIPFYSNGIQSIKSNRMFFAIRFVSGNTEEFWDNNDGKNYCLDLKPF